MQITIFGAAGHVGMRTVNQAIAQGHTVVAVIHSQNPFGTSGERLIVKTADIYDRVAVAAAIEGSDAVISCLGSWHTKGKNVLSKAMASIIPAMESQGVSRIVTLTGAAASDIDDPHTFGQRLAHTMFGILAKKVLTDGEEHIRLLRLSTLTWTVVRAPVMNNVGSDGYKLKMALPSLLRTIKRDAVAVALVDQLQSDAFVSKAPCIYRA